MRVLYRGSGQGTTSRNRGTSESSGSDSGASGGAACSGEGCAADGTAGRVWAMLQEAGQEARLLYSDAPFSQEKHSCPFDFSQPVPAGEDGKLLTYEECLAQHGLPLEEGYDYR